MPAIASLEDLKAAQKDLCSKCLTVTPYDLGFTPYDQGFTLCSMRYALCCMEMAPHWMEKRLQALASGTNARTTKRRE